MSFEIAGVLVRFHHIAHDSLKRVFNGKSQVNMFEMIKLVSRMACVMHNLLADPGNAPSNEANGLS
jgi:hypothetical protein